ncbi:MAG: HAD family hydrolase [Clostridiales bacterium]|nr:HAD family hydrolase [Clostridiales bacterium]
MGKTFENWLVVSDVDGTLHSKFHTLPKNNYEAIKKFTSLGGNFTLASARTVESLSRVYRTVPANQPAIIFNGGAIYDVNNREIIWKNTIGSKGRKFVSDVIQLFDDRFRRLEVGIFCNREAYIIKSGLFSNGMLLFDRTKFKNVELNEVPTNGWLKVIFWGVPSIIKELSDYIDSIDNPDAHFLVTSPLTIEMMQNSTHKGRAVMQLADMLGIEKSHVAAMGDYYNDVDMLSSVGLPACAGQAPQAIHDICKYEACHCNKGCVADLLNHIMTEM